MNDSVDDTKRALLALGLEDWIPIPEAVNTPEVREAVRQEDAAPTIRAALTELVSDGQVRVYRGRWDADPAALPTPEALDRLREDRWYSFHPVDPDAERLYFVNVENIHDS